MKAVKLCRDCGRPIKNATNFRVVCDGCLRKKGGRKGGIRSALWKMKMPPGGPPSRSRRKSPSRAWPSA